jgi:hypothetical protein
MTIISFCLSRRSYQKLFAYILCTYFRFHFLLFSPPLSSTRICSRSQKQPVRCKFCLALFSFTYFDLCACDVDLWRASFFFIIRLKSSRFSAFIYSFFVSLLLFFFFFLFCRHWFDELHLRAVWWGWIPNDPVRQMQGIGWIENGTEFDRFVFFSDYFDSNFEKFCLF